MGWLIENSKRRVTKEVKIGNVWIGGNHPIAIQSMTNTDTRDVGATLAQIRAMAAAGADIVRVSVYDAACARAVRALVDGSDLCVAYLKEKKGGTAMTVQYAQKQKVTVINMGDLV